MQLTLDLSCGKTSQECSVTKQTDSAISSLVSRGKMLPSCQQGSGGRTLVLSLDRDGPLSGELSTLNISESPNDASECFLWQVLQPASEILPKYYLSRKAKDGILSRAKRRGKALPPMLEQALRQ